MLILAQPQQGMVLSKSIYRLAATVVGLVVATMLTALFPQDRTMLLASFTVVMAIQTAPGGRLRGHVRDGMRALRMGQRPRRTVTVAVHQD